MSDVCDNKSVGMLVWKEGSLLMIERKKYPFGFAPPAGHVDSDSSFESAAIRELLEETGLKTKNFQLLTEGRKDTSCRRGGTWHYWKIYKMKVEGDLIQNIHESKQIKWFSKNEMQKLARRTQQYIDGRISEEEWQASPGIEVVWYEWLTKLKIIKSIRID
jgi:ADP-ribose pyrophosphatase YjhB (NUDIX family)